MVSREVVVMAPKIKEINGDQRGIAGEKTDVLV